MFCPALGIPEDPVSGNAHAMLASLLARQGLLPPAAPGTSTRSFIARQGHAVCRPGALRVSVSHDRDAPAQISVGGNAVVIFATTIEMPGMAA